MLREIEPGPGPIYAWATDVWDCIESKPGEHWRVELYVPTIGADPDHEIAWERGEDPESGERAFVHGTVWRFVELREKAVRGEEPEE